MTYYCYIVIARGRTTLPSLIRSAWALGLSLSLEDVIISVENRKLFLFCPGHDSRWWGRRLARWPVSNDRWQSRQGAGRKAYGLGPDIRIGCLRIKDRQMLWWSFPLFPMLSYFAVPRAAWDPTFVAPSGFPGLMFLHAVWILRIFPAPNYQLSLKCLSLSIYFLISFLRHSSLFQPPITPQSVPSHRRRHVDLLGLG